MDSDARKLVTELRVMAATVIIMKAVVHTTDEIQLREKCTAAQKLLRSGRILPTSLQANVRQLYASGLAMV